MLAVLGISTCFGGMSSGDTPYVGFEPAHITVHTDQETYTLIASSDRVEVRAKGRSPITVPVGTTTPFELGGETWSVREKDDGFVVVAPSTEYRFKARDDEGYTVRHPSGAMLYKVKFKDDKFNVYDAQNARILYGKGKGDRLVLRDDRGTQQGRIEGERDLRRAAILAVPVPLEVRAIAFAHSVERLAP